MNNHSVEFLRNLIRPQAGSYSGADHVGARLRANRNKGVGVVCFMLESYTDPFFPFGACAKGWVNNHSFEFLRNLIRPQAGSYGGADHVGARLRANRAFSQSSDSQSQPLAPA